MTERCNPIVMDFCNNNQEYLNLYPHGLSSAIVRQVRKEFPPILFFNLLFLKEKIFPNLCCLLCL